MSTRWSRDSGIWRRYAVASIPGLPPSTVIGGPRSDVGARLIGTSDYPIPPSGVKYVSTTGDDANDGLTIGTPFKTMQQAMDNVAVGGTVVVRAGSYNGPWACSKSGVTVQPYPNEAVWFDGSVILTGWVKTGSTWAAPWSLLTDHSPGTTSGEPEVTSPGWFHTDPLYPTAPWPEMVFLDGVALLQVATEAAVGPGKFYIRGTASGAKGYFWTSSHVVIGDDPTGHEVRVTNTAKGTGIGFSGRACALTAPDITIRGVGWRRWGVHMSMYGAVYANDAADRLTVEHCVFEDTASFGFTSNGNDDVHYSHITAKRHGLMALGFSQCWRILVEDCVLQDSNTGKFCFAPESGDVKAARTRDAVFIRNRFGGSAPGMSNGPALWADELCYNWKVISNDFSYCGNHGLIWELSTGLIAADNLFMKVADMPFIVNTSGDAQFWNNTVVDCSFGSNRGDEKRSMWLVQSTRDYDALYPGDRITWDDRRNPPKDPTIKWKLATFTNGNNAWGPSPHTSAIIRIENAADTTKYPAMGLYFVGGNVYNRVSGSDPTTDLFQYPSGQPYGVISAPTLASWQNYSGQDAGSVSVTSQRIVTADGQLVVPPGVVHAALPASVTAALPIELVNSPRIGAWR